MPNEVEYILVGNRIPFEYFLTKGIGESSITVHAGSLDGAMKNAGIENYNLLKYTSIMPGIARLVDRPKRDSFEVDYKGARKIVHGSVCEAIMAQADCMIDDRATAGLVIGWIYDKETNKRYGGLVAEYSGSDEEDEATADLEKMMNRMARHRMEDRKNLELRDVKVTTASIVPKKKHGTAIVAIGFLTYVIPKLKDMVQKDLDELYAYKSLDIPKVDGKDAAGKAAAADNGTAAKR